MKFDVCTSFFPFQAYKEAVLFGMKCEMNARGEIARPANVLGMLEMCHALRGLLTLTTLSKDGFILCEAAASLGQRLKGLVRESESPRCVLLPNKSSCP